MMWIMSLLWRSVVTILNSMETSLVSTIRAVVRSMRSISLSLRRQLMARRLSLSRTLHLILSCSIVKVGNRCLVSLLRSMSKTHLTKKIIAVHIWPLFFYELIFLFYLLIATILILFKFVLQSIGFENASARILASLFSQNRDGLNLVVYMLWNSENLTCIQFSSLYLSVQ